METLARLGVATIELIEAEGRSLRRQLIRLGGAAGVGFLLLCLSLAGLGFILSGFYLLLAQSMPGGYAALIVGAGAIILSGAGAMVIGKMF